MPRRKVSVIGAGQVGATTAFLLAGGGVADVTMIDVTEGLPQGKALDMMHARMVRRFSSTISGTNDYAGIEGSDVIVVTAGLPRKPGMSRDDLLAANAEIVRSVAVEVVSVSPEAVLLCVTNPLDVMTYLAWKASGLPSSRVLGMGGVLDSARFAHAIAEETGADVDEVDALVIGAHGDAMVPLPRHSTVAGKPLTDLLAPERIKALVERTVRGGIEVVSLLKTGSAFYAPAASIVTMVEAVLGDTGAVLPSCVYLDGQYGIHDTYISVPAVLGREGVVGVVEIELDDVEAAALRASAATVAESIAAAQI